MSNKVMVKGVLFAVCVLVAAQMLPAPAWGQGGYTDIYVLGRPGSTFSPHSPKDLEELKDLFDRFEADLRVVLEKGGWGGDPDDFFRTIRSAQQGDGTVTPRKIQPGESL